MTFEDYHPLIRVILVEHNYPFEEILIYIYYLRSEAHQMSAAIFSK